MKRVLAIGFVCALLLPLCLGQITSTSVQPVMLASPQARWTEIRTITASNVYPAVANRDYPTVTALPDANNVEWELDNWARKAMFSFQTTANADATVVEVWGFADNKSYDTSDGLTLDDDAVYCGALTLTGGQQTGKHSNVYVDTIGATSGVLAFTVSDSGNDRRAIVECNTKGLKTLIFIATTLQGSSTLYVEGRLY